MEDLDRRATTKRRATGQHLEENGADGKEIAARVGRLAHDLFGRHVAWRTQQDAGAGEAGLRAQRGFDLRPRQPEVEQLDAVRREKHVRGLEIAVNDTAGMER